MTAECKHCGKPIEPCDCGAVNGRLHWIGVRLGRGKGMRWCRSGGAQPHEPKAAEDRNG